MAFQILVSNKAGVKGEIVGLFDDDHIFSAQESLQAWIVANPDKSVTEYHRNFSIAVCTDESLNDNLYLLGSLTDRAAQKYYFVEPDVNSQEYIDLYSTGQVTATKSIISTFLREHI